MNVPAALSYAGKHGLEALLVRQRGEAAFESFAEGFDAAKPHALYSGTKSFWGIAALAARDDGLLELDEPVGATFASWAHGRKAGVTLRMLLDLTSGIGFGGLGNAVPMYPKALAVEVQNEPGERFTYGGIPLQVFGAVLARKLAPRALSPHEYLRERILAPLGVHVAAWRRLADGTQPLPTGAFCAAPEWATFGEFVLERRRTGSLAECFRGSQANPRYGLGWWLSPLPTLPELVYASGAGGQALYVVPEHEAVVVKFGRSASFRHEAFLKRLFSDDGSVVSLGARRGRASVQRRRSTIGQG